MDPAAALASPRFNEYIAHETARLTEVLAGLDAEGWRHPVPACPPWDVRELAVHLTWVAEQWGGAVRKAVGGDPSPPWPDVTAWRQQREGALRALTDAALGAASGRAMHEIQALLAGLSPEQHALPAWHRSGQQNVARYQVYWFWEIGVHCWDLRSAFDPGAGFDPETRAAYVDVMTRVMPRCLGPDTDPDLAATYHFDLRDPERIVSVRLAHGTHEIVLGAEGAPDVTFRLDGTTWVLALLSRIDPAAATTNGRIQVDGDAALAARFWKQIKRY